MANSDRELLDPLTLSKIKNHQLLARIVVESYTAGLHRSVAHGFGSEFLQYRNYSPGDDLKYVDWKVYGRQNKVYTKVYNEETNFDCHIVLDASGSMNYQGTKSPMSKIGYASAIAASLGYLANKQGDGVGLYAYNENCSSLIKPSTASGHLDRIFAELNRLKAEGESNHRHYLSRFAELMRRRGLVVFISDFLDQNPEIPEYISKLSFARHDCLVIHVIDDDEEKLPFSGSVRFYDAEDENLLITCPDSIREDYQHKFKQFCDGIKHSCLTSNIDYLRVNSTDNLSTVLSAYLNKREMMSC